MQPLVSHLAQCAIAHAPPAVGPWLLARVERVSAVSASASLIVSELETAFSGAGRRLGHDGVELSASELAELVSLLSGRSAGVNLPPLSENEVKQLFTRVSPALLGRMALLLAATETLASEQQLELVNKLFYTGDASEREAVLRVLSLLPEPQRFVELGVDACRTHVQSVFDAIACENPFPARFFTDAAFNQLVIKALFTEVALERILGLSLRANTELSRMADNYASERRAAGRSVPVDIDLARGSRA